MSSRTETPTPREQSPKLDRLPPVREKDLHRAIAKLLNWKKIVYIHSRTDQRTTQAKGVPDFLFAVFMPEDGPIQGLGRDVAVAWEVKTDKGTLRPEQKEMHFRMQVLPNCWQVKVIRSLDDAIHELKVLGL